MPHPYQGIRTSVQDCGHFVSGEWITSSGSKVEINSPYTGSPMASFRNADQPTVEKAIAQAHAASKDWSKTPIKERSQVMYRFRDELIADLELIASTKSFESGKTIGEAKAGLLKGIEVLEFALSIQNMDAGGKLEVSRGVSCEFRREPIGVVSGITPFNFPAMVPMWMIPIALTLGNSFVWKPSEKTPMTSLLIADCLKRSGLPAGVLTVLQGQKETVEMIIDHPLVASVGFVGSTDIARKVYQRATNLGKRCLALGGAKNHIILLPDADPEIAAQGIADSFTGCCGQRCMAASVLLAVGDVDQIIGKVKAIVESRSPGVDLGAIITKQQVEFLHSAIAEADAEGADVVVDGRNSNNLPSEFKAGNFIGATILDNVKPKSMAATKELFGPILSIIRVKDLSEALEIEASNAYGNATSVFTSSGAMAEEIARSSRSGMVGVNIGVPVPREPFSFGGTKNSKFGMGDITGIPSFPLWSDMKKVTVKWHKQNDANWMS